MTVRVEKFCVLFGTVCFVFILCGSSLKASEYSSFLDGSFRFTEGTNDYRDAYIETDNHFSFLQNSSSDITLSPASASIWEGCSVTFSVETSGLVDSYRWELSVDNGISWTYTGSDASTLSLVAVSEAMNLNLYRCIVSKEGIEEVSLPARVTVQEAPEVNAGEDESICVNGAQNRLSVALHGHTTATSFFWEVINGSGELINKETLTPTYFVNPKDGGKEIVFRLTGTQPEVACSISDEMILTVNQGASFGVSVDLDGEKTEFKHKIGVAVSPHVIAVPVRFDSAKPELEQQNFFGDKVLINKTRGGSLKSRAFFSLYLYDLPLNVDLSQARLLIYTSQAGGMDENTNDVMALYRIKESWNPESVTWANQPSVFDSGITAYLSFQSKLYPAGCESEDCVQIRKRYEFGLNDIFSDWYNGEEVNYGFMLKLSEEDDVDVEFVVDLNRHPQTSYDNYHFIVSANADLLYVCKHHTINVEPELFSGNMDTYVWSGPGIVAGDHNIANIAPRVEIGNTIDSYHYSLKGSDNNCGTQFSFYTAPTPFVRVPDFTIISGALHTSVNHRISGSVGNLPNTITWETNGEGGFNNPEIMQPTYLPVLEDFGKTIDFTVTATSALYDCEPEIKTTSVHILKPLYPYAGEDVSVCRGETVKFSLASLGNVPGISDPEKKSQMDALAESYVTGFYWEIKEGNGHLEYGADNRLNPVYFPAEDDEFVECRLYVSDGDSYRSAPEYAGIRIHYIPLPEIEPGIYEPAVVGSTILLDKTVFYNSSRQTWDYNGNGVFTLNEGGAPSYMPSVLDLNNENQQVVFIVRSWNENDCNVAEAEVVLPILPSENVSAGEDVSICIGDQVQMGAQGGNQYFWSPETGLNDPHVPNPLASPMETTLYTVVIISEHEGVEYTVSDQVLVTVHPLPDADAGADRTICPNTGINLTANNGVVDSRLKYEWFVGDDLVSEAQSPLFFVDQAKVFRLKVTGEFGCVREDYVSIQTAIGEPDINISYPDCSGSSVLVSVSGFESVSWQPAESFACPLCATTLINSPGSNQTYVFSGSINGCAVEKEFSLSAKPGPIITGKLLYEVCPDSPVSFDLFAEGSSYSYSWEPSEGLSSNSVLNPVARAVESTGYTLKATDANGCTGETEVLLRVVELPQLELSETLDICKGSGIDYSIPRHNASGVEWSPVSGVSNPNGFYTTLSPDENTTYSITVSNGNCEVSGQVEIKVLDLTDARFHYSYPGLTVIFTPIVEQGLSYFWEFGDGQTLSSTEPVISHTYLNEGDYSVCLKINGECGQYEHCASIKVRKSDNINCD